MSVAKASLQVPGWKVSFPLLRNSKGLFTVSILDIIEMAERKEASDSRSELITYACDEPFSGRTEVAAKGPC